MHYDSLDILPIKLYYKIAETGNLSLLSSLLTDENELQKLWFELDCGFKDLDKTEEATKTFRLSKSISALEIKHQFVLMACETLRFEWNEEIINILRSHEYTLRDTDTETFFSDLERIEKETNSIVVKVNMLRRQLPKTDNNKNKSSLDEVMASYASILGFDFDFNTISCTKFFALQSQVHSKVKALETQQSNSKK
jgi:hypothetical protein